MNTTNKVYSIHEHAALSLALCAIRRLHVLNLSPTLPPRSSWFPSRVERRGRDSWYRLERQYRGPRSMASTPEQIWKGCRNQYLSGTLTRNRRVCRRRPRRRRLWMRPWCSRSYRNWRRCGGQTAAAERHRRRFASHHNLRAWRLLARDTPCSFAPPSGCSSFESHWGSFSGSVVVLRPSSSNWMRCCDSLRRLCHRKCTLCPCSRLHSWSFRRGHSRGLWNLQKTVCLWYRTRKGEEKKGWTFHVARLPLVLVSLPKWWATAETLKRMRTENPSVISDDPERLISPRDDPPPAPSYVGWMALRGALCCCQAAVAWVWPEGRKRIRGVVWEKPKRSLVGVRD